MNFQFIDFILFTKKHKKTKQKYENMSSEGIWWTVAALQCGAVWPTFE